MYDCDWMTSWFESPKVIEAPGIRSTRWFDATFLAKKKQIEHRDQLDQSPANRQPTSRQVFKA